MKDIADKKYLSNLILAVLILGFAVFIVFVPVKTIIKRGQELSNLGKQSLLLDRQKENFEDLNKDYRAYRASIDNIEAIFVDKEAPVDFIKFLEKISRDTDLEIKISASNLSKSKTDPWPAIAFQLSGTGQAGAVLRFLEKLETGPYLTEILSLNFGQSVLGEQGVNEEKSVKASLLIKVFAK